MTLPRILVAEDDEAVRDMLRQALERDGFEVVTAATVSEALRHIAAEDFDVLLSDLHMPNAGDDFTVVSAMRDTHPGAVTLVLSGYPALEEAMSAILLQADEVLVKPVEVASLREIIRRRLATNEARPLLTTKSVASTREARAVQSQNKPLHLVASQPSCRSRSADRKYRCAEEVSVFLKCEQS
jgi:DNA-binding NtrC family response regulator